MAEIYQVDQYRYTGGTGKKNPCVELLNTYPNFENPEEDDSGSLKPIYRNANFIIGKNQHTCYQDVLIPFSDENIEPGKSYYIDFHIVESGTTDTNYVLKLVNSKDGPDYKNYEVVKRFTVPANTGSSLDPVRIVLYSTVTDPNNQVDINNKDYFAIGVVNETISGANNLSENYTEEYLYYNEVQVLPTWIVNIDDGERYHYSTSISSNYYEAIFDALLLEIERIDIDKDIVTPVSPPIKIENDENEYDFILGRWLNVDKPEPEEPDHLDVRLYSITNLLEDFNPKRIIKKIGVWGRPGLPLIINGSEIQIGPSGVFEFEGIDITSFGVFANGPEDKFVVDYQYVVTE